MNISTDCVTRHVDTFDGDCTKYGTVILYRAHSAALCEKGCQ